MSCYRRGKHSHVEQHTATHVFPAAVILCNLQDIWTSLCCGIVARLLPPNSRSYQLQLFRWHSVRPFLLNMLQHIHGHPERGARGHFPLPF